MIEVAKWVQDEYGLSAKAAEAITEGDLVAVSLTDGLAYQACADSGAEHLPALGIATATVAAGEWMQIKTLGKVRGIAAATSTGYYYTSNTPGAISATAGDTSQKIGYMSPGEGESGDYVMFLQPELITYNHVVES